MTLNRHRGASMFSYRKITRPLVHFDRGYLVMSAVRLSDFRGMPWLTVGPEIVRLEAGEWIRG